MLISWPLAGFNRWEQQANLLGEILLPSKRWSTSRTDLTFSPLPVWKRGLEPQQPPCDDEVMSLRRDTLRQCGRKTEGYRSYKSPRHTYRKKAQLVKPWWGLFVTCHQTNSQPALTAALKWCLWVLGTNVLHVLRMWPSLAPAKTPA